MLYDEALEIVPRQRVMFRVRQQLFCFSLVLFSAISIHTYFSISIYCILHDFATPRAPCSEVGTIRCGGLVDVVPLAVLVGVIYIARNGVCLFAFAGRLYAVRVGRRTLSAARTILLGPTAQSYEGVKRSGRMEPVQDDISRGGIIAPAPEPLGFVMSRT